MEAKDLTAQSFPKHLYIFQTLHKSICCAEENSEFFRLISDLAKEFEHKLNEVRGKISQPFYQLHSYELKLLKEELINAMQSRNELQLERLCRCLANQENNKSPLVKLWIVNLSMILTRLDKGEITINQLGTGRFEALVDNLRSKEEELSRISRNLRIAEEALKNRDEVWTIALDKSHLIQAESFSKLLNNYLAQMEELKTNFQAEKNKMKRETKERLEAKDQMIISLTQQKQELNERVLELQEQLIDKSSDTSSKNAGPRLANKLSTAMMKDLHNYKSPVTRRLSFVQEGSINGDGPEVLAPDYDDLQNKFKKITTGKG